MAFLGLESETSSFSESLVVGNTLYILELSDCFLFNSGKSTNEFLQIIALFSSFQKAQEYGYDQSMMARFYNLLEENVEHNVIGRLPVLQLTIQYRMHPDICLFPSNYIYNRNLKTNRWALFIACSPVLFVGLAA